MKVSSIFSLIFAVFISMHSYASGTIHGTVHSKKTGQPIVEGDVDLLVGGTYFYQTTPIGAGGTYQFTSLPDDTYTVKAYGPTYQTALVGVTITGGGTVNADAALTSNPGQISGTVVASMTPVMGVTVTALQGGVAVGTTITDASGVYELPSLPPGSYSVVTSSMSYQSAKKTAAVDINTTTTVDYSLQSNPATVMGTITDVSSTPIANALVNVVSDNVVVASFLTNATGIYSVQGLAPGSYTILVSAPGYQQSASSQTLSAGMTTTANFQLSTMPATITGTVTDAFTDAPLSGAVLDLYQSGVLFGTALTDNSGSYTFNQAAAGNYTITASNLDYSSSTSSLSVAASGMATQNFQLIDQNGAPQGLQGDVVVDQFLFQDDRTHQLQWNPNPGAVSYNVYRNNALIATVPSSGPLEYIDHNRSKKVTDYYQVTGVDAIGNEGPPASIALR